MVMPLEVDSLLSNGWNMRMHNKQLLDMTATGTCIAVPAWTPAKHHVTGPVQAAALSLSLATGMLPIKPKACTCDILVSNCLHPSCSFVTT